MEDAPHEIATIKEDLLYLISIFKRVESSEHSSSKCMAEGATHCQRKVAVATDSNYHCIAEKPRQILSGGSKSTQLKGNTEASRFRCLQSPSCTPLTSKILYPNNLKYMMKPVDGSYRSELQIQQLMLHAISKIAIAAFETTSLDILARDSYIVDECGQPRAKTFVYADRLRYSIHHTTSSFQTPLGPVWVRKTTIYPTNDPAAGSYQTVTSIVFYPRTWMKCLGFQRGLEAAMSSAGRSWLLNCRVTLTRAVPEDSLIFELCRTGQTRAVETLLGKGLGSVVDTSPKGWKPLHFAAAAGHVDLCTMLIRAGADKSALVYKGPSESILKIQMLRMFYDCIDLTSPEGDGWQVHEWLKRAYATEKVPISQNSITWLLHLTAKEQYVECNPRVLWSGLQHAVRSVLNHERYSKHLEHILQLWDADARNLSLQHVSALSSWIALRVTGRVLVMAVQAGAFLRIKGFDWTEDDMTYGAFLQAQPGIYADWCNAVLDAVDKLENHMREELELYMRQLCWTQDDLLNALSSTNAVIYNSNDRTSHLQTCSRCQHNYTSMAHILVEPARIEIQECVKTGHSPVCICRNIPQQSLNVAELPEYTGMWCYPSIDDVLDAEEDFFDAQPYLFDPTSLQIDRPNSNVFSEAATLLYTAQGRNWIGSYAIGERLCASCFFFKERYIGEDGFAAEFPPMPESFVSLRTKW
ncbi:hypothetical protein PSPO01_06654 [Paraphaeosphaeria sporulosa]